MSRILAFLALPFVLVLTGCGVKQETFRYRLTVEVETPDGLRSGSSVIEVVVRETGDDGLTLPEARGIRARLRGEVVAVELPDSRVLFALLRSQNNVDAAKWWPYAAVDTRQFEGEYSGIRRTRLMKEQQAGGDLPFDNRPMLVTFADLDDPTSVARVDPDDLAASFGEGVTLRRITVQLTDDPVTSGIEERLGWLKSIYEMGFSSAEFPEDIPSGNFSGLFRKGFD